MINIIYIYFFLQNMCVYYVYLLCIYKYTHMQVYIKEKCCLYIKYIYI